MIRRLLLIRHGQSAAPEPEAPRALDRRAAGAGLIRARRVHRLVALALLVGCATHQEPPMPTPGALLPPCPASPNCVSSLATDEAHRVAPLPYQGDPAAAMRRLRAVIAAMPRTRIVSASDSALHAEFTSFLFRFVDDVNCAVDPEAGVIQIRSASRVGYSDLGVNRRRVEAIRAAFEG